MVGPSHGAYCTVTCTFPLRDVPIESLSVTTTIVEDGVVNCVAERDDPPVATIGSRLSTAKWVAVGNNQHPLPPFSVFHKYTADKRVSRFRWPRPWPQDNLSRASELQLNHYSEARFSALLFHCFWRRIVNDT